MTNTVTNQKSQTSYKAQKIISNVIIYAFLIFLLLLSIVPFYLVVVNATHSSFDIVTKLNLLPGKNTLENYTTMQSHVNIWRGFLNSLCVAVPFTFFTGYFGALTAFGFAKYHFKGKKTLFAIVLASMMLPSQLSIIGFYQLNLKLNMLNTYTSLILPGIANASAVFFLRGFIAMSIADRPGLAVGFAGGVLAMNGTNFAGLASGDTTGISGGFLAALLAGFAAGYIVQFLKNITEKLPASLNGIRPMLIYPLGGILVIGLVMCGINPLMGIINTAMSDWLNALGGSSKILLGAIVAGMMSVDMGGPFNKAAYVFGTAALASGNYEVMAAVMVGGMVPPIAIALSTTFCPKKWSPDERRNGIVNYVMGLCFVSEGAIPYAATDPLRVLPSCIIGSALSGALSMVFGCALRAPHGGIFVFPVVDHALLYVVALAAGSAVGAVILSLLKKDYTAE